MFHMYPASNLCSVQPIGTLYYFLFLFSTAETCIRPDTIKKCMHLCLHYVRNLDFSLQTLDSDLDFF
jgi:hypothetical protein